MINKTHIVIAVLATFCLTSTLFMVVPTRSQVGTTSANEYNIWIDTNDDGIIDIFDLAAIALAFGAEGEPINKTALLLDLQNRVSALEERQDYVKTIRFYTPNETMTDNISWVDAAIFVWTPKNATDNAIIQGASYFQYLPNPMNYQLVWRILINDIEVNFNSVINYSTAYLQSSPAGFGSWTVSDIGKPNQSTYTVKFQIRCAANYPSYPAYMKDINILLQVMDGLPPS